MEQPVVDEKRQQPGFDELMAGSVTEVELIPVPPGISTPQKLAVFLLFTSLGGAFYGGLILLKWPIESYGFAFLIPAAAILLGSVFFISKNLRYEELTSDVVVLSWLYVPLAFIIPFFIQHTNIIGSKVVGGNFEQFLSYSPVIWGGSFALLALMLTIAAALVPKAKRPVRSKRTL